MADDLKYGYKGAEPTQSFGNNTGVFDPNDINNLIADNKWTTFGQLELIETQEITSSTPSMIFDSIQESTYNVHFLTYSNFGATTDNRRLVMRFFESGVEESGSVYQYAGSNNRTDGSFETKSTGATNLHLGVNGDTDANIRDNGYIYIYNAGDSSKYTFSTMHTTGMYQNSTKFGSIFLSGVLPQTSVVDQIKLFSSTDNIASLTASLYGIRYS
jgi:hypothetical protein